MGAKHQNKSERNPIPNIGHDASSVSLEKLMIEDFCQRTNKASCTALEGTLKHAAPDHLMVVGKPASPITGRPMVMVSELSAVIGRRRLRHRISTAQVGTIRLRELDGRNRPLSIVARDGNSQAVHFIEPNVVHCPSLSIGEDHSPAGKLSLGLHELAKDFGRSDLRNCHR
jgi:hypothetical protein